ncbi:hypothetical protein [Streptomyces endophytica]|uniref:Uncharacterized protein n=1 Tax=Streptomyces endophytica TaxID=2991496 RepID=A0ABY6PK92_9ACTN|nr:hypothetical protein [Streptomyces endophytica]UZJ33805.1 hypothetical protein OJ254_30520 [Streptomyces endophytica]
MPRILRVFTIAAVLATAAGYGIDHSAPSVARAGHLTSGVVLGDSAWGRVPTPHTGPF